MNHIKSARQKGGAAITIYLDELFAVEFIMNYLILIIYCQRNQKKYTLFSRITAAVFASIVSIFIIGLMISVAGWNICCSILTAAAAAWGELGVLERMNREKSGFRRRIVCLIRLLSGAVLMAGSLLLLSAGKKSVSMIGITGMAGAAAGFIYGIDRYRKWIRRDDACCVQAVITLSGKTYTVTAITDTGNQLYDPVSRQPIHIIERNVLFTDTEQEILLRKEPERFSFVPYASLGNQNGILTAVPHVTLYNLYSLPFA